MSFKHNGLDLHQGFPTLTDGLGELIYQTVTSDESDINDMYRTMDRSLVIMNVAMARLDSLQTGKDEKPDAEKGRALWMAGLGTAGPRDGSRRIASSGQE